MIPVYIFTYFWFEITNPGEWVFMVGSVVIFVKSYQCMKSIWMHFMSDREKLVRYTVSLLWCLGEWDCILCIAGLSGMTGTFIAPSYDQMTYVIRRTSCSEWGSYHERRKICYPSRYSSLNSLQTTIQNTGVINIFIKSMNVKQYLLLMINHIKVKVMYYGLS